jgi:hypothetical protein
MMGWSARGSRWQSWICQRLPLRGRFGEGTKHTQSKRKLPAWRVRYSNEQIMEALRSLEASTIQKHFGSPVPGRGASPAPIPKKHIQQVA